MMASNIDATKPTSGIAQTSDVRANFLAAKDEIEALQVAAASATSVTGSRGGNAALASLLTVLDGLGIITDNSSA